MARNLFWQGYRATIPMMIGVAPFGLVFGALAITSDMTVIQALGMSIIVLAGSSQFVAAELIGEKTPIIIIVFTTFVINLRHFLYSASLADYLNKLSHKWKALLAYVMVDEVYAVAILKQRAEKLDPEEFRWFFLGAAFNLVSVWWGTTILGAVGGEVLPTNIREALGFTLPLVFTSIVVPSLINRPAFLAAISALTAGVLFAPLPNKLGLIVAAGIGITVGVLTEVRQIRKQERV